MSGYLDRGELVPDEVVLEMVRAALVTAAGAGLVLDGVPRTMQQARALYQIATKLGMTANVALHLQVDAEPVRRLLERAAAQSRSDDTEEIIRNRLRLYYEGTHPLLNYYGERGILVSERGQKAASSEPTDGDKRAIPRRAPQHVAVLPHPRAEQQHIRLVAALGSAG